MVREKTDALDAAGNTTAAIGKGFAIGSAALVSLALFGAFVTRIRYVSNDEVQRQFDQKPHLLDANPAEPPDYDACIAISTNASLREMVAPGALVIFTPLVTGIIFGVNAVSGLLVGSLVASVQLAISMSNSGGAWDNAKKYVEKASPDSALKGKG